LRASTFGDRHILFIAAEAERVCYRAPFTNQGVIRNAHDQCERSAQSSVLSATLVFTLAGASRRLTIEALLRAAAILVESFTSHASS
jgi:hypothetical protein